MATQMALGSAPNTRVGASLPPQRRSPEGRNAAAQETEYTLPAPPSNSEKYAYLGKQKRWTLVLSGAAFGIIIISLVKFALLEPALYPFLGLALITVLSSTLGMLTSTRRRRFDLFEHLLRVATWAPERIPSVDVFLPSAGEDLSILENTYKHVAQLQWGGPLTVHVLDDSGREDVRILANRYRFKYLTRPDRGETKKAGNLKFGYENSTSDLIVVFDADFAPRPDFLPELVPYFDDEKTGIVQSPQYFDSDPRMNWLQRGAGTAQELFYRWVQPSRDAAEAPICVGTNAIYRRKALAAAGGFAQIGHSEDVHTGVKLLKAGYVTRYIPVLVAKGLCPDTLDGFLNQQYRWCSGSMSLLRDRSFHKTDLTWRQRLCYYSGFSYYLTTALFVFTVPLPTAIMLWGLPDHLHPINYLGLVPSLVVVWLVLPRIFHAHWGPEVLRVQTAYSYAHALAVWDGLRNRTASWVPTGAAGRGTPLALRIKRMMWVWVVATQTSLWSGILHGMVTRDVVNFLPVAMFAVLATLVQVPLLMPVRTPTEKKAHRAERRTKARALVRS